MAHVFVVSTLSPTQMVQRMLSQRLVGNRSEIAIMPPSRRLADRRLKRQYLFLLSYRDFVNNVHRLNTTNYTATCVIVFASAVSMQNWRGVVFMDSIQDPEFPSFVSKPSDLDLKMIRRTRKVVQGPLTISRKHYLNMLIESSQKGSVLNPLMTYIYTLPRSTHQDVVKHLACSYLVHKIGLDNMFSQIEAHAQISGASESKLRQILESDIAKKYRKMFVSTVKQRKTLEQACKEHNIDVYDARYIRQVLEKANGVH